MQKKRILFILALLFSVIGSSRGQDIHFSQFYAAPHTLNPALTGSFDGDWRFAGNYRNQWKSVTEPFKTLALSADANEFKDLKNIGLGGHVYFDRAGDSKFSTYVFNTSISYRWKLDSISELRMGANVGLTQRVIDYSALTYDNQFNGVLFDPTINSQESFSREQRLYPNVHIGVAYKTRLGKKHSIQVGATVFNFTKPQQSFFNNSAIVLDRRVLIHGAANLSIKKQISIQPVARYMIQGKYQELLLGALGYVVIPQKKKGEHRAVYGGFLGRSGDAFYPTAGMEWNDWRVGVSYDVNLSNLVPASNNRGAIELSIRYIIRSFDPHRKHIVCPDYL